MSDYQEYPDIVQEVRGALNPGRLKLQGNSIVFRNQKTGRSDQFHGTDIDKVEWLKRARGYCLKILLHSGHIHRFDGFKESDQEKLSSFVSRNYNVKLEPVDLSVKGWNWGQAKFEGNGLNFLIDNNLAFEIPLNNVCQATPAKSEITLEFHQNDDAAVSLMELRFHIPTDQNNQESDNVSEFYDQVMKNADIIQATGDAVCVFPEVQCLTPRGRYDIKMYTTYLQFHGKTFDYKIPYTSVLRLFLLPHKDGRQIFFVVSLDPPIKQGQTRYHFLILLFSKDDEMTLECGLGDELEERYEGKLQKEMTGLEYEIVSKVFKAVTTRKITVPGSFIGHSGSPAIGCSYKAATGLLYPLERGFIFVHKPPVHIRFDEVAAVNFGRSSGSNRSFDFDVETKAGTVYTFSNIEKDEYGKMFEFAKNKTLRMKNIGNKKAKDMTNYEDESDEEAGAHDAYLERMKAEGKDRDSDAFDDDSDSSDEDFKPEDSASDVAEEYDSNPPTSSDESEEEPENSNDDEETKALKRAEKEKRQQERREKREKHEKSKAAKASREGSSPKTKTKTKKKSKEEKDPNKPKRPQTAYFIWFIEQRAKIKEKHPDFSVVDISKKAGEMWGKMTNEEKEPYNEKNREAKKEYDIAMKEYNKNLKDEGGPPRPKSSSKSKQKSSPKKPTDTKAGSGSAYKSKEFISDVESSSDDSDEDDKPLKKLKREKMEVDEESGSGSASEEEKPSGVKRRSQRKDGEESDVGELPDDEEILSSPEHSEPGSPAGSDSGSGSGSGSGSDSN